MSPSQKCRVIEVGLGGRGADWAPVLHADERLEMVGGVDVNADIIAQHREKFGLAQSYYANSVASLVQRTPADFAVICAPSIYHPSLIDNALDAGLHVVVEKPFTVDFAEAKRVTEKAKQLGKQLVIAQNYRYWPNSKGMRDAIQAEHIGKPEYAIINHGFFASPHITVDSYMRRLRHMHAFEMSCHLFDLMRFIFGRNAVRIYGRTYDPSWSWYVNGGGMALASIEFEGGLHVEYHGSFVTTGPGDNHWSVEGAKGALLWTHFGKPRYRPAGQMYLDGKLVAGTGEGERELPVPDAARDLQAIVYETIEAAHGGPASQCRAEDNLNTLAICDAVARSSDSGAPVTVSA
ncbi:Gfo/Idh/MocA family oxidoreductase [Candidatus Poribacteria bacterium]|nr:Gfo/Idh/MocA family oxidoreductase [Candidatus Poribacteria bacterium]